MKEESTAQSRGAGVGGADGPRGALSGEAMGRDQGGPGWELLGRRCGGELPPSLFWVVVAKLGGRAMPAVAGTACKESVPTLVMAWRLSTYRAKAKGLIKKS